MTHREDALLLLQVFRRRALPSLIRRLQTWKGLDRVRHADLIDDLEQELWLDCLEHAPEILALSTRERHVRWLRLVERNHYQLHLRVGRRRAGDAVIEALPDQAPVPRSTAGSAGELDPVSAWGGGLPAPRQAFLRRLAASATYLKNGRINCRASAESLGVPPREVKARWDEIAADLGFDSEFLQFWRRRLVEALLGLAADLLRDAGRVRLYGEDRRRRPDPSGRLRRIRDLYRRIGCRPLPGDLKHVLSHYHHRGTPHGLDPVAILEHARTLRPFDPAVHLWRFEAHLAAGDSRRALRAIRTARLHGAERVPVLLARARCLEFRGRSAAARRLLDRRRKVAPRDDRLRAALRNLAG